MSVDLEKNKQALLKVYDDVLNDKTSTDWALFGYEGQTNVLKVIESGDFGVEEMADDLNASKIMYGVVRIIDPKTSRTKIILINWQGEGAPNLRKGVCARHLTDVKRMLKGVHITVTARTEDDADLSIIMDAVSKATSTEYNFSDRSELPEKNVPVGTNYKRTNPQAEINAKRRNKFWEEQEEDEKIRKAQEICKRQEEAKLMEMERVEREIRDCKHRDEVSKERNTRIIAEKKAESDAYGRTINKEEKIEWEKELEKQHTEEVDRAKRADQMRMERKKEAENLIGHRTHLTRSMFESQCNPSSQLNSKSGRPPPRKLKDFNPSNADSISNAKEDLAPKRSIGVRWPPTSTEESISQHTSTAVPDPGKIAEWKPLDVKEPHVNAVEKNISVNQQSQSDYQQAPLKLEHQTQLVQNISTTEITHTIRSNHILSQDDDWSPQKMTSPDTASLLQKNRSSVCNKKQNNDHIASNDTLPKHQTIESNETSLPIDQHVHFQRPASPTHQPSSSLNQSSPVKQLVNNQNSSQNVPSNKEVPQPLETHFDNETESIVQCNNETSPTEGINGHSAYEEDSNQQYPNESNHHQVATSHYESDLNPEDLETFSMMYEVDGIEYQILPEHGLCARALYDYQAADETEITFDPGDIITNIEQIDVGWWQGVSSLGVFGLFPANYVELINGTKEQ